MGRSPNSCLRLITCSGVGDGSDPSGKDAGDLDFHENKSSGDKRGWSFRKKSARHRGLSNSVVLETPVTRTRETLESALLKSPSSENNDVPEKPVQSTNEKTQLPVPYVMQPIEEKTQLPVPCAVQEDEMQLPVQGVKEETDEKTELGGFPLESKGTETGDDLNRTDKETESEVNDVKELDDGDADAIVIEKDTGFKVKSRGSKTDDVIKIVKEDDEKPSESLVIVIQAAIRGFLARRELLKQKKAVRLQAAVRGHLVRRHAIGSLRVIQAIIKMQALVRARLALQSKEDSGRGSAILEKEIGMNKTNVASAPVENFLQNKFARHLMESTPVIKPIYIKCDPTKPSSAWNWLERWMSVSSADKTSKPDLSYEEQETEKVENVAPPAEVSSHDSVPREAEENLTASEADEINQHQVELYDAESTNPPDVVETPAAVDSHVNHSHPSSASEMGSLPKEPESVDEQPKHSLKRKASNPSFIAAHTKFEELTSSAGSKKPVPLSYKDVVGESKTDRISSEGDTAETPKDHHSAEEDFQGVSDKLGGHESATEVSLSSVLETPDKRSEVEAAEPKNDDKLPGQGSCGIEEEEEINIDITDTTLLHSTKDPQEEVDLVKGELRNSLVLESEQNLKTSTPDAKKNHPETETGYQQVHSFSPEASSPRVVTESQATPASQASSVKTKKGKTEKSGSSQKRKASKKTTSSPKLDSGGANNVEQQAGNDHKSGKRRNSFGFDQEPRDGSSGGSSTLPRFMQPTESAKAKVQEHNSPRSSPDVQERDTSAKKRHSLPGANGKQGSSPRVQRPISQAQQATKEKKWQR